VFRAPARVTFALGGKSNQKRHLNLRFKDPRTLYLIFNLVAFPSRSQNMSVIVLYDASTFFLRRCRSCGTAVDTEALFGVGISGSGTGAETILLTKQKREFYVNVR